MIFVETPRLSSSRSPWQCKNETSVRRTAKEFAVNRKCVREWCQSATAHWKDKPAECLENAAVYAVANLCQSILTIEILGLGGTTELVAREDQQLLIEFLGQHVGVAPEEGAYSRNKMSDPAYKPPLRFRLALRLPNGGRIRGTLRYYILSGFLILWSRKKCQIKFEQKAWSEISP